MKKQKIIAPKTPNKSGYQIQDVWFHRAKSSGYRARSAFKLLQIQEETQIIKPGMTVLDLGCAPGSWIQVLSKCVGDSGRILGIDLQTVDKFAQKNITTIAGDITSEEIHNKIREFWGLNGETSKSKFQISKQGLNSNEIAPELPLIRPQADEGGRGVVEFVLTKNQKLITNNLFNLITSDVAPNTTGRNDDDQYYSAMLCLEVLKIAEKFLAPDGSLVMKIFVGRDLVQVLRTAKNMFESVRQIKPSACRDRSFEEYIVCRNRNVR